jgi:hypothetical protein
MATFKPKKFTPVQSAAKSLLKKKQPEGGLVPKPKVEEMPKLQPKKPKYRIY